MAFVRRRIDLTFQLGTGPYGEGAAPTGEAARPTTFWESGTNKVKVSGNRVICRIVKSGGLSKSLSTIDVYGMPKDRMNELSTLGLKWTFTRRNEITVEAGDDQGQMATVFQGTIVNAYPDFSNQPEVPLRVEASAGHFESVKKMPPTSYKGGVDVATILSGLASKAGWAFENNGVSVMLSNQYLSGSLRDQIVQAVQAAGIEHIIDNRTLAIWNPGQARGSNRVVISKRTGMEASPIFQDKGITVSGLWFPSISYGGKVQVESDIVDQANGEWVVYKLDYELDAEVPGGRWHYRLWAGRPSLTPIVWR